MSVYLAGGDSTVRALILLFMTHLGHHATAQFAMLLNRCKGIIMAGEMSHNPGAALEAKAPLTQA